MGMESYYINITLSNTGSYDLSDPAVLASEIVENKTVLTVSYSFFSFFDGISRIYSFLKKYESRVLAVESMGADIKQSTADFLCFFNTMYSLWEKKLNVFRTEYGYFLINSNDDFFKNYKKFKNYIKK